MKPTIIHSRREMSSLPSLLLHALNLSVYGLSNSQRCAEEVHLPAETSRPRLSK